MSTVSNSPPKSKDDYKWKKGFCPNPLGRPKKVLTAEELFEQKVRRDLKAAAKDFSAEALQTLVNIMRDSTAGVQHRLAAASQILDRGHGKPTNHTELNVNTYERLSDAELIKFITGQEIEGEAVEIYSDEEDVEQD